MGLANLGAGEAAVRSRGTPLTALLPPWSLMDRPLIKTGCFLLAGLPEVCRVPQCFSKQKQHLVHQGRVDTSYNNSNCHFYDSY